MIHKFSTLNAFGMGVAGLLQGKFTTSEQNCNILVRDFSIRVSWSVPVNYF